MVLEATVVCLDNSEWMRNGDYTPTRKEAQHDAVNLICGAKTQSNPESTVAIATCAGKSPAVLVTLTSDLGKILSASHNLKLGGSLNFVAGIQVAQLTLKHRQNKNQHQRIIFFVGSPITTDTEALVRLAKRLKKNSVAIDIINFGEEATNTEKLETFLSAVNNNDNSHLLTIPPGPHILSDILISSPIINEDGGASFGGSGEGGSSGFPVDANLDPELALAIKVSMEEDRARREADAKKAAESSGEASIEPAITSMDISDEEAMLAQAIAMSMQEPVSSSIQTPTETKEVEMFDVEMTEEQEMELATQMSMSGSSASQTSSHPEIKVDDPFNSILMNLPGVDLNDERIKGVLDILKHNEDKEKQKEKDKEKEKDKDKDHK